MMKNQGLITLLILLSFTLLGSAVSYFELGMEWAVFLVISLGAIKFMLVAFQFMELKEAHRLWKILLGGLLGIYLLVVAALFYLM